MTDPSGSAIYNNKMYKLLKIVNNIGTGVIQGPSNLFKETLDFVTFQKLPYKKLIKKEKGVEYWEILMTTPNQESEPLIARITEEDKKKERFNLYGTYSYVDTSGTKRDYTYFNAFSLLYIMIVILLSLITFWVFGAVFAAIVIFIKWRKNRQTFDMTTFDVIVSIVLGPVYLTDLLIRTIFWQYF